MPGYAATGAADAGGPLKNGLVAAQGGAAEWRRAWKGQAIRDVGQSSFGRPWSEGSGTALPADWQVVTVRERGGRHGRFDRESEQEPV